MTPNVGNPLSGDQLLSLSLYRYIGIGNIIIVCPAALLYVIVTKYVSQAAVVIIYICYTVRSVLRSRVHTTRTEHLADEAFRAALSYSLNILRRFSAMYKGDALNISI